MQGASLFCSLSLLILATTARPAELAARAGSSIEARLGAPISDRLADLGPYSQYTMSALGAAWDC